MKKSIIKFLLFSIFYSFSISQSIESVNPAYGHPQDNLTLSISGAGTNFGQGSNTINSVYLYGYSQGSPTTQNAYDFTVNSTTSIDADFLLSDEIDTWDVCVNGENTLCLNNGFVTCDDNYPNISMPGEMSSDSGESITFDLDDYIIITDCDETEISYTTENIDHISVNIDQNNFVTISQVNEWTGSETVTFTIADISYSGFSSSDAVIITFNTSFPELQADFTASPTYGGAPLAVTFTDLSTEGSSAIVGWYWDFGDSTTGTEQNPAHTYEEDGVYTVSLTVTDADGLSDTKTKEEFIEVGSEYTGPTDVSGNVSGIWTQAGSPYIVTGNLLLLPEDTLSINPGVEVRFDGNYKLDVFGTLFAVGTEADSISFVSHEGGTWMSINFADDANDDSRLEYCIVDGGSESGYDPYYGMVNAKESSPTFAHNRISNGSHDAIHLSYSNSIISDNLFTNISGDGIEGGSNSTPTITNNTFENINTRGIYLADGSNTEITQNTFTNIGNRGIYLGTGNNSVITGNNLTEIGDHGIYLSGGTGTTVSDNNLITIGGGGDYGIYLASGSGAELLGNTLETISGNGIYVGSGSDSLSVNDNALEDITGYGIYFYSGNSPEISNNSIINTSNTAIYFQSSSSSAIVSSNLIEGGSGQGIYLNSSVTYATISGNEITGKSSEAIYLNQSCSYTVIDSNQVSGNSYGIHLYDNNDNVDITNNTITDNGSNYGIKLLDDQDNVEIVGNTIDNNGSRGIELYYRNKNIDISENSITNHTAYGIDYGSTYGGNADNYGDVIDNLIVNNGQYGVYYYEVDYGDCEVRNNTIDGHSSYGLYWRSDDYSNDVLDATNNSITNNGTGIYCQNGGDYNTIAYNNSWNNSSGNYEGDLPTGTGALNDINPNNNVCDVYSNISENPLYQDQENSNYYLQFGSPNVDAGDPNILDTDGTVSDIGVFPLLQDIAIILVSPSAIDFGIIDVGSSNTVIMSVSSMGTIDLEVTDIIVDGSVFSVSPSTFTVFSGQSQDVEVVFTPDTNTDYEGSLTIVNNSQDNGEFTVSLEGTGFIPPDISVNPQQINMSLLEGQSGITRSLTIGNSGTDDLVWFMGGGEVEFTNPGTYNWVSTFSGTVSAVCIGGGGGAIGNEAGAGGGGGLGWKNDIPVIAGNSYTVVVGTGGLGSNLGIPANNGGDSYFQGCYGYGGHGGGQDGAGYGGNGGTYAGDGGGSGGTGGHGDMSSNSDTGSGAGGGGAGGYMGDGGNGGSDTSPTQYGQIGNGGGGGGGAGTGEDVNGGGGGTGIYGEGLSGAGGSTTPSDAGGKGGSGGQDGQAANSETQPANGGLFGGGGSNDDREPGWSGAGGAVRLIWGFDRFFPSTNTHYIEYTPPDWLGIYPFNGTVSSGSSQEVVFTFDATTVPPGDYSADVTIFSNDPDEPEVIIPISLAVFSEETSYMYVEDQQVARNSDAAIPIRIHASGQDSIAGMVFALSILPNGDVPDIGEELGLSVVIGYGADAVMTQTGPGQASIALSGFDPPLSNDDLTIAHLILPVPGETENGDTYSLNFSGVSGTTDDYELIEMEGMQNITLTVITGPPEIIGLVDIYLLEGSATALGFTVSDEDGTDISVELTEAPDYVTLDFTTGDEAGTIDIAPPFGAESGYVEVAATNSEPVPETTTGSFFVFVNHYPVFSPTETIYLLEGDSAFIEVGITDVDGDTISMSLQSAPDYVTYTSYSETGGMLEIITYAGAVSGDIVFAIADDGTPSAETTSGFTVIMNHTPEIMGLGDFHVPENDVLDTLISFYDFDGDSISYAVLESPSYLTWETIGESEGILLTIAPDSDSEDGIFTLRLTDPGGMSTQQSVNIFIYETFLAGDVRPHDTPNSNPVAGFTFSVDGTTVYFTNTSTDADGDSLTYSWNFGDGYTSTEFSPVHTYYANGSYTVSLTASDGVGQDVSTQTVVISDFSGMQGIILMLSASNPSGEFYDFYFGFTSVTTDGYDQGYCSNSDYAEYGDCINSGSFWIGDQYAPPAPPAGTFDCALTWASERYYSQLLDGSADNADVQHEFGISLAFDSDNSITINWNNSGWDSLLTSAVLQDAFGGAMINVDMLSETSYTVDNPAFTGLKLLVTPSAAGLGDGMGLIANDFNLIRDYDDAGEFGDGIIAAPDVVNTLRLATQSPDTDIPDSTSNLYDAFDTNPIDEDMNGDGDVYDGSERGGDGFIEAADVIVTLKRATMVPGYPYIMRVDNEYPFSTRPDGNRLVSRDGPDTLYFGEAYGAPGTIAQVPVWLKHNSETPLSGLVSGFGALIEEGEYNPEEALSFSPAGDINVFQANDGNDFVSVLLTEVPETEEGSTSLLGYLEVEIPETMETESSLTLTTRSASGSGPDYELITVDGLTGVLSVMLQSDAILFNPNWNLMSFDIELLDYEPDVVFSNLIESGNLIYVTGFMDGVFEYFDPNGLPFLNTLTSLESGNGYWVKVQNTDDVLQEGYPLVSDYSIDLLANWNLIAYWLQESSVPEEAFAELIENENLIYVTGFDEEGASFFDPNGLPIFNTLNSLDNGFGYWVKVIEGVEGFQYPTPSGVAAKQKALNTNPEIVKTNLFMFVNGQADFQFLDFEVGSKINVYTQNELLVGEMEILENGVLRTGAVYGDDKTTQVLDGAIESEKLIFRYHDIESVPVNIQFTGNMELQKVDLIFKNVPTEFSLDQNFPNPFNPITTIRYGLPEESQITISIVDILGRGIRELVNEEKPAGYHTTIWDGKDEMGMDVSSGVYFYTLNGVGFSKTQKMILLR